MHDARALPVFISTLHAHLYGATAPLPMSHLTWHPLHVEFLGPAAELMVPSGFCCLALVAHIGCTCQFSSLVAFRFLLASGLYPPPHVAPTSLHECLLLLLGWRLADICMCYACILALMAWLVPRLCVHVSLMHTYFCGLAGASPMCACATHAYLLLWLGSGPADVCICFACILTLMAWHFPRLCMHVLCICTYSYGLARFLPMCAYAMHAHLLLWFVTCTHVLCMCTYSYGLAIPRLCMHVPCICTYPYGLARSSPMCAHAMHAYLVLWLGSFLACVFLCNACILTLMAWLVPCLSVHVRCMYTYFYGLPRASPMYACACMRTYAYGHAYLLLWLGSCLANVCMCVHAY